MIGIKTRLARMQKRVKQLEDEYKRALDSRIQRLGYEPDEVYTTFPFKHPVARVRLMVRLEYEELFLESAPQFITEPQFACCFYPTVVLGYLHYLLDEIGVPPVAEIAIYREWILETHPSYVKDVNWLEHKWRAYAREAQT